MADGNYEAGSYAYTVVLGHGEWDPNPQRDVSALPAQSDDRPLLLTTAPDTAAAEAGPSDPVAEPPVMGGTAPKIDILVAGLPDVVANRIIALLETEMQLQYAQLAGRPDFDPNSVRIDPEVMEQIVEQAVAELTGEAIDMNVTISAGGRVDISVAPEDQARAADVALRDESPQTGAAEAGSPPPEAAARELPAEDIRRAEVEQPRGAGTGLLATAALLVPGMALTPKPPSISEGTDDNPAPG